MVFGSAVRPEDYVEGVSDIDLLVIVDDELLSEDTLCLREPDLSLVFASPARLRGLFDRGYPLAWMLIYDSRVLYDDGTLLAMGLQRPPFTELTRSILGRSILAALGLGVEQLFAGFHTHCLSHFYHSLRHALRLRALEKFGVFPCSDREVLATIQGSPARLFDRLVALRKREEACESTSREVLEELLKALHVVSDLKIPSLSGLEEKLEEKVHGGAELGLIRVEIVNNRVVWVLEVLGGDGPSRWVFDGERLEPTC